MPVTQAPPLGAMKITPAPVGRVALGPGTTCAVRDDGGVECWGRALTGARGPGSPAPSVVQGLEGVVEVAIGESHGCARVRDGTVSCWGSARSGALGHGTPDTYVDLPPSRALGVDEARSITVGRYHSCALREGGTVVCWGHNIYGQLGDASKGSRVTPAPVPGLPSNVIRVAGGADGSCALTAEGEAWCWGDFISGNPKPGAVRVKGVDHAVSISIGLLYRCALRQDGAVSCWRWYEKYCDVDGGAPDIAVQIVGMGPAVAVAAGAGFACALEATGRVFCWGYNEHGMLGDGTRTTRCLARPVAGLDDAVEIAAATAGSHVCARRRAGGVVCWGANDHGQLGRAPVRSCESRDQTFHGPVPKPVPCALTPVPLR